MHKIHRSQNPGTNPVGTGAVDYDEIVARRVPRLCGSKVASNQKSVIWLPTSDL